jgi:hypothetical protein
VLSSIERVVPSPEINTVEPSEPTLEIDREGGHSPASCRNVARSSYGNRTLQRETGDAPSSSSTTGRRYGKGALPKTSSLPYVCPFEVEK